MKKFNLGTIKMEMDDYNTPKSLILNRELDFEECRYISNECLGFDVKDDESFESPLDYVFFKENLQYLINGWLKGERSDEDIMIILESNEYCKEEVQGGYFGDGHVGVMRFIKILSFFKR